MNKKYEEQMIKDKVILLDKIDKIKWRYGIDDNNHNTTTEDELRAAHEIDALIRAFEKKYPQQDSEWDLIVGWGVGVVLSLLFMYFMYWLLINF